MAAVGEDRPGIVAELTGSLLELGCNLRDVATSVLSGQFALVIVCDGPDSHAGGRLEEELRRRLSGSRLHLNAWDIDSVGPTPSPAYVLTVYGPDRPGIVHAVAEAVSELGVGICDMSCRYHGDLYLLTMELDVPDSLSSDALDDSVSAACARLGLQHALNPMESAEL